MQHHYEGPWKRALKIETFLGPEMAEASAIWGGGVLLVHNEIHYVPIGNGWREVLVRNVIHYVPGLLPNHHL